MDKLEEARKAALAAWYRYDADPTDTSQLAGMSAAIDAFLSKLKADGYVIVPVEATDAMTKAGMAAKFGSVMVGGIQHAEVKLGPPGCQRVWSAMIAASHPSHEEGS